MKSQAKTKAVKRGFLKRNIESESIKIAKKKIAEYIKNPCKIKIFCNDEDSGIYDQLFNITSSDFEQYTIDRVEIILKKKDSDPTTNVVEDAWIKIPSSEIFAFWDKHKRDFLVRVDCPYCHDITFIWCKTEENKLHLKCSCEIPPNPTPKFIEVKLTPRN